MDRVVTEFCETDNLPKFIGVQGQITSIRRNELSLVTQAQDCVADVFHLSGLLFGLTDRTFSDPSR